MKKTLIALTLIVTFAASSFASVSFLTAGSVGEGKCAVLGMYASNHNGAVNNITDPQNLDATSLGVRVEYGIMKDLDLLAAYSMDTLVNVKELQAKQDSATTTGLGVKYTIMKNAPVDVAVALGYESSTLGLKMDVDGKVRGISMSTMTLGCIVSQQMGTVMPYGAIAYKSLSQTLDKNLTFGADLGSIGGTSLAFNLGCAIGIAANQAILVEFNNEVQSWAEAKKGLVIAEAHAVSVSGISLGYVYMF